MYQSIVTHPSRRNGERRSRIAIPLGMDILDAAYHTAHDYPGGVPAVAQRMGISANTLQHKVSLTNDTHLMSPRQLVSIQEVTGDARILHAMAGALGYACVSLHVDGEASTLEQVMHMAQEFGEVLGSVNGAVADGRVTPNEMLECERQAAELIAALNGVLGVVRSMMPRSPAA